MGKTSIEWAEFSWNPIRARRRNAGHTLPAGKSGHYCQKISPGCKNCYAESMNLWRGNGIGYTVPELAEVELYLDEDALMEPMRWRKPKQVFVCSMTDLFADFVPENWISAIYAVEAMCARHTFMHLTKRSARRLEFLTKFHTTEDWAAYLSGAGGEDGSYFSEDAECHIANSINGVLAPGYNVGWPMRNVREGTSICTQKEADDLIPIFLQTPAALRFVSCEPLLGPIDLTRVDDNGDGYFSTLDGMMCCEGRGWKQGPKLDWVIVGGESGPRARPMHPEWARGLRDQCADADVPFFFKQWGEYLPVTDDSQGPYVVEIDSRRYLKCGKASAGSLLDDTEHKAFPAVTA
ncbi:MAG: DUF5131 family protein [Terracidiphilus sp.]